MTSTYALLLTDVVDSTRLTEELGELVMSERWYAHDRMARDLMRAHDGREIDRTDGFLLLFRTAMDAAAFAVAYHRGLRDLDLKARAGLHVGPVSLYENAPEDVARGAKQLEVEGLAKPLAARVMSVATGGQTLASADAVAELGLVQGTVSTEGLLAVSHGHWQLKGVSRPVELFELGFRGEAAFVPPPDAPKAWRVRLQDDVWVPVREIKRSLPAERDAFVGREDDLRALADRLDEGARLVSVLGIGGTGKTRLVTRFAWTWLGEYPGGAWFCDLSEARSVDGIASALATALDVPLGRGDPIAQLGHAIAGRGRCLVVLDNFEQVARQAAATLGRWLDVAPDARFVVTTREVLGLPGELALALAPLAEDDAVALFVARAQQAKRDFALATDDRPHIQALVKLLDGLPLAIELAAARVRVMPPKTLLQRMSERFRLLASTGGRHARHATLKAALDWSWELLSADEQAALAQLSVFEGGFTLEAAEAVLSLGALWPTDAVQALVDKSLVRQVTDGRFDLLVSVQEYAAEKLDALGGRADAEARHGACFAALGAEEALAALGAHGGTERRRALSLELDNAVAACRRAVVRGDGPVAAATFLAAWGALELRGPFEVAADVGAAVLGMDLTPEVSVRASAARGHSLRLLGRMDEARALSESALTLCHELGDGRSECVVLGNLGNLQREQGRLDAARALFERALAVSRDVGDPRPEGLVLANLGNLHLQQGRIDDARALYEQALARSREVGDRRFEGNVLGNLGALHAQQGRVVEAQALYEQALSLSRLVGDRRGEGLVLGNLGNLHQHGLRLDEARAMYEQALAVYREVGERRAEGHVLGNLGNLHLEQGRMREAQSAFAEGEHLLREVGDPFELVKLVGSRARLDATLGLLDDARRRLAEAEALAVALAAGPDSEVTKGLARARAALDGR